MNEDMIRTWGPRVLLAAAVAAVAIALDWGYGTSAHERARGWFLLGGLVAGAVALGWEFYEFRARRETKTP